MKFGHFDDRNKEYVITTPQTPLPWINYLGSEDFFGALDALVTLDALLYLLLYVFGFAFAFYPLTRWCKANEGFSWPWPHVKSEKKRFRELRKEQEQQEKK